MKDIIKQDPNILNGKPIIAGTRMSVDSLLELLASGMAVDEILNEFPFLKKEQVTSAIQYAAKVVQKEEAANSYPFGD